MHPAQNPFENKSSRKHLINKEKEALLRYNVKINEI